MLEKYKQLYICGADMSIDFHNHEAFELTTLPKEKGYFVKNSRVPEEYPETFLLKGTKYFIFRISDDSFSGAGLFIWRFFFEENQKPISLYLSFQEIFNQIPDEIKSKLLFDLDDLINLDYGRSLNVSKIL